MSAEDDASQLPPSLGAEVEDVSAQPVGDQANGTEESKEAQPSDHQPTSNSAHKPESPAQITNEQILHHIQMLEQTKTGKRSGAEVWATIVSGWAQVAMLLIVTIGYLYTVRPVFQQQLLEEKAAKLELENEAAASQLNKTLLAQKYATDQLAETQQSLNSIRRQEEQLKTDLATAESGMRLQREKASKLQTLAFTLSQENAKQAATLYGRRWEDFKERLHGALFARAYNNVASAYGKDVNVDTFESYKKNPSNPLGVLTGVLATVEAEIDSKTLDFPQDFINKMRWHIAQNSDQLTCDVSALDVLERQFVAEQAAIPQTVDKELGEQIDKVVRDYAAKNQRAIVTDEYRAEERRLIKLGKESALQLKYQHSLSELERSCASKADAVVANARLES